MTIIRQKFPEYETWGVLMRKDNPLATKEAIIFDNRSTSIIGLRGLCVGRLDSGKTGDASDYR